MTGIEFVVYHAQEPELYVIRKQKRLSPTLTEHLATFYVLRGSIYQCPTIGDVITSRMVK